MDDERGDRSLKDVLSPRHVEVLHRFAWSNVLVGLDFDGTLAPIVARPGDAQMRARTRALLGALAERYPVAIVSGRGRRDVSARLDGVRVDAVVGNHGLEPSADAERCKQTVHRWLPRLRGALEALAGVQIEDKTYSLAIHYRRSRQRRTAIATIRRALEALPGHPRVVGGKLVVNVLPEGAPHKGVAMLRLRDELGADTALYVGDDVTDEDVFAIDDPGRLLGIRVGRDARSRAPYFVQSQRALDALLEVLVSLRDDRSSRVAVAGGRR